MPPKLDAVPTRSRKYPNFQIHIARVQESETWRDTLRYAAALPFACTFVVSPVGFMLFLRDACFVGPLRIDAKMDTREMKKEERP